MCDQHADADRLQKNVGTIHHLLLSLNLSLSKPGQYLAKKTLIFIKIQKIKKLNSSSMVHYI